MRLITLFAVMMLFAVVGCSKEEGAEPATPEIPNTPVVPDTPDDPGSIWPDGFVIGNTWKIINEPHFILTFAPTSEVIVEKEGTDIELVYFPGGKAGMSVEEMQQAFDALYQRYGDLTYNVERKFYGIYQGGFDFLMDNLTSIDITCNKAFDAEHPAGTSLNDVCELFACSPRQYIASGYTEKYDWSQWPGEYPEISVFSADFMPAYRPFNKMLNQCTPEDLVLMGNGCHTLCKLRLAHAPEQPNSTLIITITDESGEVYTHLLQY